MLVQDEINREEKQQEVNLTTKERNDQLKQQYMKED